MLKIKDVRQTYTSIPCRAFTEAQQEEEEGYAKKTQADRQQDELCCIVVGHDLLIPHSRLRTIAPCLITKQPDVARVPRSEIADIGWESMHQDISSILRCRGTGFISLIPYFWVTVVAHYTEAGNMVLVTVIRDHAGQRHVIAVQRRDGR